MESINVTNASPIDLSGNPELILCASNSCEQQKLIAEFEEEKNNRKSSKTQHFSFAEQEKPVQKLFHFQRHSLSSSLKPVSQSGKRLPTNAANVDQFRERGKSSAKHSEPNVETSAFDMYRDEIQMSQAQRWDS